MSRGNRVPAATGAVRPRPAARLPARYDVWGAAWTLIRTDFRTRYHGMVLGYFWSLLKPLAMFSVLAAVFSFVFTWDRNYAINLMVGLFIYEYFSEATKTGLTSLHAKGYLITKGTFPRWILACTSTVHPLLNVVVISGGIMIYLVIVGRAPSPGAVALYALYLVQLVIIVAAFSLASSLLFLRYRDLNQIWEVVAQAGFFFTPVIYPISALPERYHFYLYLWPPTSVIQFSRGVLTGGHPPTLTAHLLLLGMTVLCLGVSVVIYRALSARAAEYL